jgi:hypothetical protein
VDILYATSGSDSDDYIEEMRLQNTQNLSADELRKQAEATGSGKVARAVEIILKEIRQKGREDK